MTQEQEADRLREASALRRILAGAARNAPREQSADRVIGGVIVRVAQDRLALPVTVSSARESRLGLAEISDVVPDLALILSIEGPGDSLGLLTVDPGFLEALVQMLTMGRLRRASSVARRPTRTDAAMTLDFVDSVLKGIEAAFEASESLVWAGGFRYATMIEDRRGLITLLEDIPYRVWQIEMQLGADPGRVGTLHWIVPEQGQGRRGVSRPAIASAADGNGTTELWNRQLSRTVMASKVRLDAVLHRMTLPLSVVMGFRAGAEIPLPEDALSRMWVEAGNRRLMTARLGQQKGYRAVRLTDPSEEEEPKAEEFAPPKRHTQSPEMDFDLAPDLGGGLALSGFGMAAPEAGDLRSGIGDVDAVLGTEMPMSDDEIGAALRRFAG